MAKKYAFLFPGQGAQEPGMIKDVCESFPSARKVLDAVSSITGKDMAKLLWETEQTELSRSDNSQLAITTASLAVCEVLKEKGIVPSAAMGFSLGEFPALCVSGVLSFEDVIRVVQVRGKIMQKVCEDIAAANAGHAPGMSAIIGLPPEKVQEICGGLKDVYAANLNSPKQTVISGTADGLAAAEKAATEAGARRAIRLSVAGPFHSPLMQKAADEFEKAIAGVAFNDPEIDLFSNVTGSKVTKGSDARKNAVFHLIQPVQWTSEEKILGDTMTADTTGEWTVLETGVGKVLSGLWRDSGFGDTWTCTPVNSAESINGVL
jgi:[acyl-carrier-protein] S-malonyltransferase